MNEISTPRLVLNPFRLDDAAFLTALMQEDGFLRFIGDRGVHDEASAQTYIEQGPWACMHLYGYSLLCVRESASGRSVGMCGLLKRAWLEAPDLGFAISEHVSGNGYAQEAARGVLNHWVDGKPINTVLGIASPDNAASHRVLEAVGFQRISDRIHPDSGETTATFEYPA